MLILESGEQSRNDETGSRSATESACTKASARKDAEKVNTLTDGELSLKRKWKMTF